MAGTPREGSAKTGSQALARLIRERREGLGMTRQDLADATGVPYPTIAQIETAYRGVSPSRLGVIARALGMDPAELYNALASDTGTSASATKPTRRARSAGLSRGNSDWLANPTYASQSAPPLPEPAPPATENLLQSPDVVEHVVALLTELPPEERLDALGRVQSRVLSDLVQEQVRRATKPPQR